VTVRSARTARILIIVRQLLWRRKVTPAQGWVEDLLSVACVVDDAGVNRPCNNGVGGPYNEIRLWWSSRKCKASITCVQIDQSRSSRETHRLPSGELMIMGVTSMIFGDRCVDGGVIRVIPFPVNGLDDGCPREPKLRDLIHFPALRSHATSPRVTKPCADHQSPAALRSGNDDLVLRRRSSVIAQYVASALPGLDHHA